MYNKAYYERNKDKFKIWQKAYRKAHKEEIRVSNETYQNANPEIVKAWQTAYYEANKEKLYACTKAWREANPERSRDQGRKRRVLKRTTRIESINEKIVFMRDGWICQHCKKRVDKRFKHPNPMCASLDHIIPLSKGGTHTYDNVQLAHLGCNSSKCNNVLPQGEQLRLC